MQDYDDLDRAIFALPLATPPADLRAAILRSTIYSYATVAVPTVAFATREIVALGAAIAVAVWLAVYAIFDPSFGSQLANGISSLARSVSETQTYAWLAAGAAVAVVANNSGRMRLPRLAPRNKA